MLDRRVLIAETMESQTPHEVVPRSLEKEDDEHDVNLKPFVGTLRVKARPEMPDQ